MRVNRAVLAMHRDPAESMWRHETWAAHSPEHTKPYK